MIEVAKDARHEFGALPIVACKEAGDKQVVRPDADEAGTPIIIAPYGVQDQLRAWVHPPRLQMSGTGVGITGGGSCYAVLRNAIFISWGTGGKPA